MELIYLLNKHKRKIPITCPLNKKAILEFIADEHIILPEKKVESKPVKWQYYTVRGLNVLETDFIVYDDSCYIELPDGQIRYLDIKKVDSNVYVDLYDDLNDFTRLTPDEFIRMIDTEDVTILRDID